MVKGTAQHCGTSIGHGGRAVIGWELWRGQWPAAQPCGVWKAILRVLHSTLELEESLWTVKMGANHEFISFCLFFETDFLCVTRPLSARL